MLFRSIAAIFTSSATPQLFKACVYATLVVPVLFYGYLLMFRVLKARHDENTYDYEAEAAKALKNEDELTEFPDDDN